MSQEQIQANIEAFQKVSKLLCELPHRQAFHAVLLWLGRYIAEHYPNEVENEIATIGEMLRNGIAAGIKNK